MGANAFDWRSIILSLLAQRPGKTICPSEAARASGDSAWRAHMPAVRATAGAMLDRGELAVTQRGQPVDPRTAHGAIRLGLPDPDA